jgi:hypothetical protein
MIRRHSRRFAYSAAGFPPAEAIELEEKLGDLRACPKNMLKVTEFIVPILLRLPDGESAYDTRGPKISIDTKVFDS